MSELPVTVEVTDEPGDVDKVLRFTMSVAYSTNLERFIAYVTDELQTLSHDTFKQHWDWREPDVAAGVVGELPT